MSLRKTAGLLAAFGLMVGLIGGGIGAVFTDQVTADEQISVGTFGCAITDWSPGSVPGNVQTNGFHSVTYTAPTIESSAAGSAPFTFTVSNTGSIDADLSITASPVGGTLNPSKFSAIAVAPSSPVALAAAASQAFTAGIQWAVLDSTDLGDSGSVTWTVDCNEQAPTTPLISYTFKSTNADNIAGTVPLHPGTIGPSVTAVDNGSGSITLNFTAGSQTGYLHCFEYVKDGNVPQQKIASNGGVNYNNVSTDGDPIVLDGLFPFKCVGDGQPATASVTLYGIDYVEVRMVFGAESDYRFDWTFFDAL